MPLTTAILRLSLVFRRKLRQQLRPIASDDAAYFVVDNIDVVEAFLYLLTGHFEVLRAEGRPYRNSTFTRPVRYQTAVQAKGRYQMRMTTKITAAVVLMLTLSGCADLPPRLTAVDDHQCRSYGIKPGEPAYAACLTQFDMARTGLSCFGGCH